MIRTILALGAIALIGLAIGFFYTDQEVGKQLAQPVSSRVPAIYSDQLTVEAGQLVAPSVLKNQLTSRRYLEVAGEPKTTGEFSLRDGVLSVVTREFRTANGSIQPSLSASYDTSTGEIHAGNGAAIPTLTFEPQIIAPLGSGDIRASKYLKLADIPILLRAAVISIEDERFMRHFGIDLQGIFRAMLTNLRALRVVQGGSTITQQLAKNLFFTPERTLGRKIMEALAALSLERRLSKAKILEMYLNEVYLGQEGSVAIHGVAEASSVFFGKKISELDLSEFALLAGIIKAPSSYNPRRNPDRAQERRDVVLNQMYSLGVISQSQLQEALKEPLNVIQQSEHQNQAQYFSAALKQELEQYFNVDAAILAGISVYTGLDGDLQRCADAAIASGINNIENKYPKLKRSKDPIEGALVALEPYSGKVRAWVGGRDFQLSQFNRVSQGIRQIGSTVKPFLYLSAMDPAYNHGRLATPVTILSDEPTQIRLVTKQMWEPENYDHKYRGRVMLRYALENSLNLPTVDLAERIGIGTVVDVLKKFRVSDNPPAVPSLALGAADTTLLRLTAGYGALANSGTYVAPRLFISAVDPTGAVLATTDIQEDRVASDNATFVVTNILRGVIERGTGHALRAAGYDRPAAGKTGTSNETRDAWFVGFTPDLVAGVWVGFDDNSKIGLTGGAAAAPIWADFMKCSEPFREPANFVQPRGVTTADVDSTTGTLSSSDCPSDQVVREVFVEGTEPTTLCRASGDYPDDEPPPLDDTDNGPAPSRKRRSMWDVLFGG